MGYKAIEREVTTEVIVKVWKFIRTLNSAKAPRDLCYYLGDYGQTRIFFNLEEYLNGQLPDQVINIK